MDVDTVLKQLTVEEKAALTSGSSFWYTQPVERLGIPSIMVSDGPHGLRTQPQEGEQLGLRDSLPATCFPTASAAASSWNPDLLHRVGVALGEEARALHVSVVLGPGVNMKRSPLCGRNFEYFSEDPYLAGELAVGMIEGVQSTGVGTSLKHFAANNQETERFRVSAKVSERALREIYLPAFEKAVTKAQPWTVMCSYNSIQCNSDHGVPSSQNSWLLTDVLRKEWGFKGLVVSDWGAVYDRIPAVKAGLDLEMPPNPTSAAAIVDAVRSGALDESVLDDRVRAVLRLVAQGEHVLQLDETTDFDAHHQLAREVAQQSIVLLKNTDSLLPLDRSTRLAVIGEFARTPRYQGAGSSQVNPARLDAALDAFQSAFDDVTFAPGYVIEPDTAHEDAEAAPSPEDLADEAAKAAGDAEVAVVFIGLPPSYESEGFDRTTLALPEAQLALLRRLADTGTPLAVVVVNGSAVELDEVSAQSTALVEAWLTGQAGGSAVVDVLSGAVNPSGHLAETFAHRLEDNPSFLNFPGEALEVEYGEGVFIGYRAYDKRKQDVSYPFGFGLSYTSFEYSNLQVNLTGSIDEGTLGAGVDLDVTNTGTVAGADVVQIYVRDPEAEVTRPVRELTGFARVQLDAGATARVHIDLDQRAFSYWSPLVKQWVVEPGEFVVEAGQDSRTIVASQAVTIDAAPVTAPLNENSTLAEWFADPIGRQIITAALPQEDQAHLTGELFEFIGGLKLTSLSSFASASFTADSVQEALSRYRAMSHN